MGNCWPALEGGLRQPAHLSCSFEHGPRKGKWGLSEGMWCCATVLSTAACNEHPELWSSLPFYCCFCRKWTSCTLCSLSVELSLMQPLKHTGHRVFPFLFSQTTSPSLHVKWWGFPCCTGNLLSWQLYCASCPAAGQKLNSRLWLKTIGKIAKPLQIIQMRP